MASNPSQRRKTMYEFENWHWENDIPVQDNEGRKTAKPGM